MTDMDKIRDPSVPSWMDGEILLFLLEGQRKAFYMTRVLVCGGHKYENPRQVERVLNDLQETLVPGGKPITLVIEGGALGVDRAARNWAITHKVKHRTFPANWKRYGKDAGPIRNLEMFEQGEPDLVVAFPGGSGTANSCDIARRRGVPLIVIKPSD